MEWSLWKSSKHPGTISIRASNYWSKQSIKTNNGDWNLNAFHFQFHMSLEDQIILHAYWEWKYGSFDLW